MSDGVAVAMHGSQPIRRAAAGDEAVSDGDAGEVRCALDLGSGGEHLGGKTHTHHNTRAHTHKHTHIATKMLKARFAGGNLTHRLIDRQTERKIDESID
jgi:hypothetical protein